MQTDFRTLGGQLNHPAGQTYQRITECTGRFSLETGHGHQDRMVAVERKLSLGVRTVTVGRADSRPVRKQIQPPDREVLLTLPRRPVDWDGRTSCELAFRGPVCFPTDHPYVGSGLQDNAREAGETGPGGTGLAECDLERDAAVLGDEVENDPVNLPVAANVEIETSDPSYTLFGSVANKLQLLSDRGYSPAVLNQLHRSRVRSTNMTYESKWKLFNEFCSRRNTDPFTVSSPVVANFLMELARDRSLSYSTLAGYRSAISRVIILTTGEDLSLCPVLNQLMKSFKRSQPVSAMRIPAWDFSVVLNYLLSVNNNSCDLKTLTMKTVFLLALASGDRKSALAALSRSKIRVLADMIVVPHVDRYVPKSYFVKKNTTKIRELRLPFIADSSRGGVSRDRGLVLQWTCRCTPVC